MPMATVGRNGRGRSHLAILVWIAIMAVGCGESSTTVDGRSESPAAVSEVAPTVLPADSSTTTSVEHSTAAATNEPEPEDAASPTGDVRPPSDATDEELVAELAENMNADAYGPGTNDCVARTIVERIGGDELRALGWTPEIMQAPGFSPYIELESQQFHVLDSALVDCVDAVDLALQSMGVSADKVDSTCLDAALGPNSAQTVLRSFPTDPDYDAGLGMASAVLECVDPVDFVSGLWTPIAPWYEPAEAGVRVSAVDQVCIVDWLGGEQRATALTVFELIQFYRWIDDPVPMVDQLDRLNQLLTTGELPAAQLDDLNDCFAR